VPWKSWKDSPAANLIL